MTFSQQRRTEERKHPRNDIDQNYGKAERDNPSEIVAPDEETEGATGALETPATPPEMTKDGEVDSNKRDTGEK